MNNPLLFLLIYNLSILCLLFIPFLFRKGGK